MQPHAIRAIFWKDLRDAIRDGRVLVALLLPIALGVAYNFLFDAEVPRPTAAVAYAAAAPSRLPDELRAVVGDALELELNTATEAEVRRLVAAEEADLGLVVPAGFDAAMARGDVPPLGVVVPDAPGFEGGFVEGALDEALRRLAGQQPPARIARTALPPIAEETLIFDRLGPAPYFVVTSAVFLIAMVALYAVPVILAEESEKKTLDALTLVAAEQDVVAAKALVGLAYGAVGLAILLAATRTAPAAPARFALAMLLLGVALSASASSSAASSAAPPSSTPGRASFCSPSSPPSTPSASPSPPGPTPSWPSLPPAKGRGSRSTPSPASGSSATPRAPTSSCSSGSRAPTASSSGASHGGRRDAEPGGGWSLGTSSPRRSVRSRVLESVL